MFVLLKRRKKIGGDNQRLGEREREKERVERL